VLLFLLLYARVAAHVATSGTIWSQVSLPVQHCRRARRVHAPWRPRLCRVDGTLRFARRGAGTEAGPATGEHRVSRVRCLHQRHWKAASLAWHSSMHFESINPTPRPREVLGARASPPGTAGLDNNSVAGRTCSGLSRNRLSACRSRRTAHREVTGDLAG